jgi:benzoyl-CoA reductase/2-hydroxyglutaryl-CoA dehydratase subunit BcrC/BadD/HgdB
MVAEPKGLERMIEEIGLIELFVKDQQDNPEEFSDLVIPLARFHQEDNKRTVQCVERGEPFLASWYACAPEIYTAMDLHWYCISSGAFGTGGIEGPHFLEDLEALDSLPVPTDICTLLRLTLHWVEARMLPIPTASIAAIAPCDGIAGLHETIREHGDWRDVPMFGPDAPYFEDERSLDYFASELRRMAAFIEEHTGRKLEMNRLREVVEESNRQYELWQEHNELRRSVPCPHGAMLAMGAFAVAQGTLCGRPEGTAWLRELVADAERRIAEKRPAVPDEKVRLLWYDLHPVWFGELIEWLEQEWGACTIQTFLTQFEAESRGCADDPAGQGYHRHLRKGPRPARPGLQDRLRYLAGPHGAQGRCSGHSRDEGNLPRTRCALSSYRSRPVRQTIHPHR